MTEQLQNLTLDAEQIQVARHIADEAQQIVETRYGTGFPHFMGGAEANLAYHNGYHATSVAEDAVRVGQALGFSEAELATAHIAGRAHDIVQLKPRGVMEAESADWLTEQMQRCNLPSVMVQAGALAILGTEPIFDGNNLVGQKATELAYPSKSAQRVALAVGSGDFGRMFSPIGPFLSHKLYQQIKEVNPDEAPPMQDLEKYLAGQTVLRENYRFPLAQAEPILGKHRPQVIAYGQEILRQVQRGDLESWQQLETQDLAFMRSLAHDL